MTLNEFNKLSSKPSRVVAIINTYYGGNWAKTRSERCLVDLKFFQNGNVKHSDFTIVKTLEVIEKGYQPKNSRSSSTIYSIVDLKNYGDMSVDELVKELKLKDMFIRDLIRINAKPQRIAIARLEYDEIFAQLKKLMESMRDK